MCFFFSSMLTTFEQRMRNVVQMLASHEVRGARAVPGVDGAGGAHGLPPFAPRPGSRTAPLAPELPHSSLRCPPVVGINQR